MKKFLKYLVIGIIVFSISKCDVFAISNAKLYPNLTIPKTGQFLGWNSSGSYTLSTGYQLDSTDVNTDNQVAYFYNSQGNLYNDSNGISFYFQSPVLITAYDEVKLTSVFCSSTTNNFAYYVKSTSGSANTMIDISKYESNTVVVENLPTPYVTDATTFNNCQAFRTTFTADRVGQYVGIWFGTRTSTLLGTFAFMGYEFELNGKNYSHEFANINSQLGNIDNTIQNESAAIQDSVNDLNNSITNEEPPNKLDNLTDSAGWLPAGPVDSILNLPLTMFQNLSNNIGKSCTPLTITLPYLEQDITLPCLNSIYEQIEGLSVWINSIGIIASAFILYSYLLKLYKWVDDTLTFRENNHIDNWGGV